MNNRIKFGNRHIYQVPGTSHLFGHERDAQFYCDEHGIDRKDIVKYDSKKEYERWLFLQQEQREGKISGLRRQVEYELIPAKTGQKLAGFRQVNDWNVENNHYKLKKDALAYCKAHGLQEASITKTVNREPVLKTVVLEQNAVYTADFVYTDKDGTLVVEDVKSEITRKEPDYVLRRKLMLHVHGIRIRET